MQAASILRGAGPQNVLTLRVCGVWAESVLGLLVL